MEKIKKNIKKLKGIVVSDKMQKTIVVKVDRKKIHPLYKKEYIVSKKYKVHDADKKAKVGDKVIFVSTRPLSKDKKWRLLEVVPSGSRESGKNDTFDRQII